MGNLHLKRKEKILSLRESSTKKLLTGFLCFLLTCYYAESSVAQTFKQLFWTEAQAIRRISLADTTQHLENLISSVGQTEGIALDAEAGKIYWTDTEKEKIQRANLDGSQVEDLINNNLKTPWGIALDTDQKQMYWSDRDSGNISRANLDGSHVETILKGLKGPVGIALDLKTQKIYWLDTREGELRRANLDGTSPETLVNQGLANPRGLAIDTNLQILYWTDRGKRTDERLIPGKVQQINLNNGQINTLYQTQEGKPDGIALHPSTGRIYWANPTLHKIQYTVSGTDQIQDISTDNQAPDGLVIDPLRSKIYWTDVERRSMYQSDLDGKNTQSIFQPQLRRPVGIALDQKNHKIYWADVATKKIQRANPDGSQIEDIMTGLGSPTDIVVDTLHGQIYWTDRELDEIQVADLNGLNRKVLLSLDTSSNPTGLHLDLKLRKIYWANQGLNTIQRVDIQGGNPEEVITEGLSKPEAIVLNPETGRIYWINGGGTNTSIRRTFPNSSAIETLVDTGLISPVGLLLDVPEGKMYWADWGNDKIYEANLDGSAIREVVSSGIRNPVSLDIVTDSLHLPLIEGQKIVCQNDTYLYRAPLYPNHQYTWQMSGGQALSSVFSDSLLVQWLQPGLGQLTLIVQSPYGLIDTTQTQVQVLNPMDSVGISGSASLCLGSQAVLRAVIPEEAQAYAWIEEKSRQVLSTASELSIDQPGRYRVTVQTSCGLLSSDWFAVKALEIFVPNLFSPNGDGKNDRFLVYSTEPAQIEEMALEVFDPRGNLIYRADAQEALEQGWNGGAHPAGLYSWRLKAVLVGCGAHEQKGTLTLLRN